jgi:hypothetical protein
MLYKYHNCFAEKTSDLGGTDIIEFEINLENTKPIFYRPYRYSEYERSIIREKTKDLLENNIIRTSSSSYASPAVLVKKKTADYRLCIDYRKLNAITIKDRYPLPHIEDQIGRLRGKKFFCSLDMTQGYYQIPVSPSSIHKTAFVTQEGQFEFLRMPFGVSNAPATFQRALNNLFTSFRDNTIIIIDLSPFYRIFPRYLSLLFTLIYILMYKMLSLNISMDFLGVGLRPPIYLASRISFQLRWIKILRLMSSTPTFQKHLIASIITSY